MNLEFKLPLIAVQSVEKSKKFYSELFGQTVILDLKENVTLSGGFALQEGFSELVGLTSEPSYDKCNNMELYFEVDDFDAFLERLSSFPDVELVHPPKKYHWQQRVARIYDPDGHMIEIGESMAVIARRFLNDGKTLEETAQIIMHPIEFVAAFGEGRV